MVLSKQELDYVKWVPQSRGYTSQKIKLSIYPRKTKDVNPQLPEDGNIFLPYIKNISSRTIQTLQY